MSSGSFLFCKNLGEFRAPELAVYDYHVSHRPVAQKEDPRIVLVVETEDTIQKYGATIPDALVAQLLQVIAAQNPHAIGVNLFRDVPVPRDGSGAQALSDVVESHPNIVWSFIAPTVTDRGIPPPEFLKMDPQRVGSEDWGYDDRTVRRGELSLRDAKGATYESFAVQMARRYLMAEDPSFAHGLDFKDYVPRLGPYIIPRFTDEANASAHVEPLKYWYLFDYEGPRNFPTYTIDDVLSGRAPGQFRPKPHCPDRLHRRPHGRFLEYADQHGFSTV